VVERPHKESDEDEATRLIGDTIRELLPPGSRFILLAGLPDTYKTDEGVPVICISSFSTYEQVHAAVRGWLDEVD
jgi:hypothetical protein